MLAQEPIRTKSGTVRITDTSVFPAKTISAALKSRFSRAGCASCTLSKHQ